VRRRAPPGGSPRELRPLTPAAARSSTAPSPCLWIDTLVRASTSRSGCNALGTLWFVRDDQRAELLVHEGYARRDLEPVLDRLMEEFKVELALA
jgi:hypothetical protein